MNLKFQEPISFLNEFEANWSRTKVTMAIVGDRVLGSIADTKPQGGELMP
jgi:hypothetical protein